MYRMFTDTEATEITVTSTKMKAKDRRKANQANTQLNKNLHGRGEEIPVQKGYRRTKMKFV